MGKNKRSNQNKLDRSAKNFRCACRSDVFFLLFSFFPYQAQACQPTGNQARAVVQTPSPRKGKVQRVVRAARSRPAPALVGVARSPGLLGAPLPRYSGSRKRFESGAAKCNSRLYHTRSETLISFAEWLCLLCRCSTGKPLAGTPQGPVLSASQGGTGMPRAPI